jgi:hypothetical protein
MDSGVSGYLLRGAGSVGRDVCASIVCAAVRTRSARLRRRWRRARANRCRSRRAGQTHLDAGEVERVEHQLDLAADQHRVDFVAVAC